MAAGLGCWSAPATAQGFIELSLDGQMSDELRAALVDVLDPAATPVFEAVVQAEVSPVAPVAAPPGC